MRVAIISDIHDNQVNLKKCLTWLNKEKIDRIICCGDVTNSETLSILVNDFNGNICLVKGNAEIYEEKELKKYDNLKYQGKLGNCQLMGRDIGVCHEQYLVDKLLEEEKYDIIFYGHTHKPWIDNHGGVLVVNPGTLGGVFQKATFAVWDIEKEEPELKILERL